MTRNRTFNYIILCGIAIILAAPHVKAETEIPLIRGQHHRLPLPADILRTAVGDSEILSAEPVNNRELLLLGKSYGRTSLFVWYRNGVVEEYLCVVRRDLSLLQSVLHRIHPSIEADMAPDRDALVLTGVVPEVTISRAAEAAAQDYLAAAQVRGGASGRVILQENPPAAAPATPDTAAPPPPPADTVRIPANLAPAGSVINLIRVEHLPPTVEDKIVLAIRPLGGGPVTVQRILKGQVRDDAHDIFLLEGRVQNQVALTRILTVAAQIVTGQTLNAQNIRVVADEAGAVTAGTGLQAGAGGSGNGGGFGGGGSSFGGGGGLGTGGASGNLFNQIRRNVGRAKVLEAGGGRVVSVIDVLDLPQVRVSIRLFEINRNKLRSYTSDLIAQAGQKVAVAPGGLASALEANAKPVGPGYSIQSLLGFLGGTLSGETQLTLGRFALDSLVSILEQQGIARALSSPSLTVLSGEQAEFQVGGNIPIPESFSPAFGGTTNGTAGVFSSVTFLNFGITLGVRPLVGDDDTVTLDLSPVVTTPDAALTSAIRQTSGTNQPTTAFQSRALQTSARLQDGDVLLVGGLLSRTTNDNLLAPPGLRDIIGLNWLFRNQNRTDDSTELVMVVNPSIVRDPIPNVALWQFPDSAELMRSFAAGKVQPQAAAFDARGNQP